MVIVISLVKSSRIDRTVIHCREFAEVCKCASVDCDSFSPADDCATLDVEHHSST